MNWAYGLTTVPERRNNLFLRTLASLTRAGFDKPRLFVDGVESTELYQDLELEVTTRWPKIRTYGNWILALAELYIRDPWADRYAIFQDDFVTALFLREYLEAVPYPARGYWNLYTFPVNEKLAVPGRTGFYLSDQLGKGAVALVFSREAVITLLVHQNIVERVQDKKRGHVKVDGGVVEAFKKAGWKEYVHNPSLVQHTGLVSAIGAGHHNQALSTTFPGDNFDLRQLLTPTTRSFFREDEWVRELTSLEQAMAEDEARLAAAKREGVPKRIHHFSRLVEKYKIRIKRHMASK